MCHVRPLRIKKKSAETLGAVSVGLNLVVPLTVRALSQQPLNPCSLHPPVWNKNGNSTHFIGCHAANALRRGRHLV